MPMLHRQSIDKPGNAIDAGDVELMEKASLARRLELFDYRCRLTPRTDRDSRTAFGQRKRNCFTDAAEATGDYCNPTIEVTLHPYHSPTVGIETQGSAGGRG